MRLAACMPSRQPYCQRLMHFQISPTCFPSPACDHTRFSACLRLKPHARQRLLVFLHLHVCALPPPCLSAPTLASLPSNLLLPDCLPGPAHLLACLSLATFLSVSTCLHLVLPDSMELKLSWESNSLSASQQISRLLYGTQASISVFTRSNQLSLTSGSCIQCTNSHCISLRSI
jgi:hypothetical protein